MVLGVIPIELRLIISKKCGYRYCAKRKAIAIRENDMGEKRVYIWHRLLRLHYKTMSAL